MSEVNNIFIYPYSGNPGFLYWWWWLATTIPSVKLPNLKDLDFILYLHLPHLTILAFRIPKHWRNGKLCLSEIRWTDEDLRSQDPGSAQIVSHCPWTIFSGHILYPIPSWHCISNFFLCCITNCSQYCCLIPCVVSIPSHLVQPGLFYKYLCH